MNAYETIDGILRGVIQTPGATVWGGKMLVQNDPIVTEDDYQLRYVSVYHPEPDIADVEAYVVVKPSGISFYDFGSNELWMDCKYVGSRRDYSAIDATVQAYNLEAGCNRGSPGAGDAYIKALRSMM
jgi:hypothetical protein